jgi:uncharacterized lipoprotein YddW (UPF0748 family)
MGRKLALCLLFIVFQLKNEAQQPKFEFRGAWIATINRIDWPSKAGASAEVQQKELLSMLDFLQQRNFNAVIFQIRPAADALYRSKTEPWSAYLSGIQGKAPDKGWDPLAFVIDECHKRGMELHAWLNPFRVSQNKKDVLSTQNIGRRQPAWTLEYDQKIVLDPGIPAVRDYLNEVVAEVVANYNVDAIHLDDYFYPYPTQQSFPDTLSFKLHGRGYSAQNQENWRRENVDLIIESLGKTIKRIKPHVKFGISPFGVWRNNDVDSLGSASRATVTNYDHLYADVIKWQRNGWIDYLIPQIYWELGHPSADYQTLTSWWANHAYNRHVYNGLASYKAVEASVDAWKDPNQQRKQVELTRKTNNIHGIAFFRMQNLIANPRGSTDSLTSNLFSSKAIVPPMPWIDMQNPTAPDRMILKKDDDSDVLYWMFRRVRQSTDHKGFVVYATLERENPDFNNAANILGMTTELHFDLSEIEKKYPKEAPSPTYVYLWVASIDRLNNESNPAGPLKYKLKN